MISNFVRHFAFKGSLYAWGGNPSSLGIESNASSVPSLTKVLGFEPGSISKCDFGNNHSLIITTDGKAYTFGKGNNGALGHDSEDKIVTPRCIESLANIDLSIKDGAVGDFHTVLLSTEGDVWTMGYGGKIRGGFLRSMFSQGGGGLGHGDDFDRFVPTPIDSLKEKEDILGVAAGTYHSLALGESGKLYVWGRGEYGVMGNGTNRNIPIPAPNPFFVSLADQEKATVKSFKACKCYSGAITDDGRCFVWGRNDEGQFGSGSSIGMDLYESEKWPIQIEFENKKVKDFALGERISVFLTEDDQVYVAGLKLWWVPTLLNRPEHGNVTGIFAGDRYAGFIIDQKDVYIVGKMFRSKDIQEIVDLKLWQVKSHVFYDKKIEFIGGSGRNHYCFLMDD